MPASETFQRTPFTLDRVVRIIFSVIALLLAVWLLDVLKGVLLPFAVACLIAYLLEPLVLWNMRVTRLRRRFIPVVLTLLETTLAVTAMAWVLIPYIMSETAQMAHMLREYATSQISIPFVSGKLHDLIRDNIDFESIYPLLTRDEWISLSKKALSSSWSFLSSGIDIVAGIVSWLVVLLYVVFIMIDYERLMRSFRHLVPKRNRPVAYRIGRDIKDAMNRYFRGQFLIAAIVGVLFATGFIIIGLPMGAALGLFIGVLNLVPYLQLISIPIAAFLCLVSAVATGSGFWIAFGQCMAVYIVVQCIQDIWLTPKIMGKAMGLNPAIILLSLSVWGTLLGFMGLIIALPLTTLLISYYERYILSRSY